MFKQKRESISKPVRIRVRNRFGGRCGYCGEMCSKIVIDHIIPYSLCKENPNREENLMPSCFSCNIFKNTYSIEEFGKEMEAQVDRAFVHSRNFKNAVRYGQIQLTQSPIVFYFER